MELIWDQAKAEETAAAADDEMEEEKDDGDNDWYGNVGKNTQEEGEKGRGGISSRGYKGGLAKDGSYYVMAQESTPATGSPGVESYALVIEAWT